MDRFSFTKKKIKMVFDKVLIVFQPYQVVILGCIFVGSLYFLKRSRGQRMNMPPVVPYSIPIIGHTYSYMFDSENFLKKCRDEHGEIFTIYIWGQLTTLIGKKFLPEVFAKEDVFDFGESFKRKMPGDLILVHNNGFGETKYNSKVAKEYISNKLGLYNERMQRCLHVANDKYIGDCSKPRVINNLFKTITRIISTPIANIFIGEEESQHEEVITTFAEFTNDAAMFFGFPPILDFIYPGLQYYIYRIILWMGIYNPATKHRSVLVKHIKNQIDKRLREKRKQGDSWRRPDDVLQDFLEEDSFDPNDIDYAAIADKMAIFIFASVYSTSKSCTNTIIDLASRPEYMQELYEEQLEVQKDAREGVLPSESLEKMKKLDSLIKESFRLAGDISLLSHAVLKDYTFSNGVQLPKDHIIEVYSDDIVYDEELQGPKPRSFQPFRHVNTNSPAAKVTRGHVVFGGGKHACPGRYFAINEIKFLMHDAILKYNFRTESGKIEEKMHVGPFALPSSCGIIFENRK